MIIKALVNFNYHNKEWNRGNTLTDPKKFERAVLSLRMICQPGQDQIKMFFRLYSGEIS